MTGKRPFLALPATAGFESFLAAKRARIAIGVSMTGAAALAPFTVNHLIQGRLPLGLAIAGVIACLLTNAIAGMRDRPAPIPPKIIFLPVLMALLLSISWQGIVGILWTFPALLLIHFMLDTRTANLYNGTVIVAASPMIYLQYDAAAAVRTAATLTLVTVFANIFSRITEAQQKQEAEQRERLDLLVRATRAGTLEWIVATGETIFSPRLKEMLGYSHDAEISGWRGFLDCIHPEDLERVQSGLQAEMADRSVRNGVRQLANRDYRLVRADGGVLWIHAETIALTGVDGSAQRCIGSFIDVSERHRQEEALRSSRDQVEAQAHQLEEQNRALVEAIRGREEVERMAQHDIRTPLNSIVAVPRLLRESPRLASDEKELLGVVERAAYRILNLVNLTLDLYRMERGTYRFRPQTVDLLGILGAVANDLRLHAQSKGVRIEILANGRTPAPGERMLLRAEELLCYSIVANLAKNAMEASPDGHAVTLAAESGPQVTLRIHNHGSVPEEIRAGFFDKYATAGKAGGTGLGTYSARLMARVQHGDVEVSSSEASGTTVTLRLDSALGSTGTFEAASADFQTPGDAVETPLQPARVLLVDDDEYNTVFLRSMLPSPPLVLETAINGRAALEAVAAHRPDVIFMDLEMPVMDGFEALAEIRRMQAAGGIRPSQVIAFSSYNDDATRRRAQEAGFDHYLNKPARRDELLAVLHALHGRSHAAVRAGLPTSAADGADITVDPDLRSAMPGFLASRRALVERLREAAFASNLEDVRRLAHQLAGSFSLYGFLHASTLCRRLQATAPDTDQEALIAAVSALAQHLEQVRIRFGESQPEARAADDGAKEPT